MTLQSANYVIIWIVSLTSLAVVLMLRKVNFYDRPRNLSNNGKPEHNYRTPTRAAIGVVMPVTVLNDGYYDPMEPEQVVPNYVTGLLTPHYGGGVVIQCKSASATKRSYYDNNIRSAGNHDITYDVGLTTPVSR